MDRTIAAFSILFLAVLACGCDSESAGLKSSETAPITPAPSAPSAPSANAETGRDGADTQPARASDAVVDQRIPGGKAVDLVERLRPLADAGDPEAAMQLFLKLQACQSALKQRLEDIPMATRGAAKIDEAASLKELEAAVADCDGLGASDYAQMGKWLSMAAEKGQVTAQISYALGGGYRWVVGDEKALLANPDQVKQWQANSMRYLQSAAAKGVPQALQGLGMAYANGVITKRDPVNAYAYWAASLRAYPSGPGSESVLDPFVKEMTAKQLMQAKQRADAIFEQCCQSRGS